MEKFDKLYKKIISEAKSVNKDEYENSDAAFPDDKTIYCTSCGEKNYFNDKKCSACNSNFRKAYEYDESDNSLKKCEKCGKAAMKDDKYCPFCGNKF